MKDYVDKLTEYERVDGSVLMCENSTQTPRPYLPAASRRAIFNAFHNISHPGIKSTQKLI